MELSPLEQLHCSVCTVMCLLGAPVLSNADSYPKSCEVDNVQVASERSRFNSMGISEAIITGGVEQD